MPITVHCFAAKVNNSRETRPPGPGFHRPVDSRSRLGQPKKIMHEKAIANVLVVVARYREDVAWTAALPYPVLVYDKSGAQGDHALPNIGRETHTYLTHIVRHYPHFADYTAFVQGDPFGHMGECATVNTLAARIEQNIRLERRFTGFADFKLKCDRLGRPHDMADPTLAGKWKGFGKDIPVGRVYQALFAGPMPNTIVVPAPAGMFFVAKPAILARPLAFYQSALQLIENDPEDAENTGHAFERLWHIVFNADPRLNRPNYPNSG
jgi:hypothetical protein